MTTPITIKVKRLHPDARLPQYARPGDAGMDLFSRDTRTLEQGEPFLFKLGFAIEIPQGYVALVKDRSGLAARGITTLGGVIDQTYRGELGVVLLNTTEREHLVKPGDRIAQLLIIPIATAEMEEAAELSETDRGEEGFGSTGR